jgi:hypothetical protein
MRSEKAKQQRSGQAWDAEKQFACQGRKKGATFMRKCCLKQ